MLSPLAVQQKTFKQSLRGYDESEVDAFLDEIVGAIKEYDSKLRDADERVAVLQDQLQANRETEDAMRRAFVAAQRTADEIVAEARTEGEQIVAEANASATQISSEQIQERETLQADLLHLRGVVRDLKQRLSDAAAGMLPALDELGTAAESAASGLAGPTGSGSSTLAERVARLGATSAEVAEHIPPFAVASEDTFESNDFEASDDAAATPDWSTDTAETTAVSPPPFVEDVPTEELPAVGSHRAASPVDDELPVGSGWLTDQTEPLPGRGILADESDESAEESDKPAGWFTRPPTDDGVAMDDVDAGDEPTRRRPWERDT